MLDALLGTAVTIIEEPHAMQRIQHVCFMSDLQFKQLKCLDP